ncbi:MAG: hypothetical protein EPO35_01430, partial [Acidobacteria bacterium]
MTDGAKRPEISALLDESRRFAPSDETRTRAAISDPGVYARAASDPEAFWAGFARELEWITRSHGVIHS